ncbi:MAG TPA: hypothetical protein VK615_04610 [Candidatus Binatia bacterium]|nr:hypothetical protein [Candidatus Binatia bacterium]
MTAEGLEPVRWKGKKWVHVIGLVFAAQVILILVLGEQKRVLVPPKNVRTGLQLGDARTLQEIESQPTFSDPAAFALPNWKGFSREGWLSFTRPEFRVSEWTEPPQWLTMDTQALATSLHEFIRSNTMAPLLIADKPLPRVTRPDISAISAPTQSELRIEGGLARWSLVNRVELPSWPHSELLTNTVVHALINSRGYTIAVAVLTGSGLVEADQFALRTVKVARFRPPARGPTAPTSGNLIFKWHTVPATNTLAAPTGL